MSFHLITCIVKKGLGNGVLKAAHTAGAHDTVLFQGKGNGRRKTGPAANKTSPSAKEIVLITTKSEQTQIVFDEIVASANLKKGGRGIVFIQEIEQTAGLID